MPNLLVATYNTYREWNGRDRILDELLREGRSLVCLQEVSPIRAVRIKHDFGPRSFVSLARHGLQYLAVVLPEDADFLYHRTVQLNGHLGLLPSVRSARIGYALYRAGAAWTDALEPRVAQEVRITWQGVDFQLINTHLPLTPALRNKCFVRLQKVLWGENAILAGDLNATPKNLFLKDLVLGDRLSLAGNRDATHDGGRRIDYVMFRGGFREAGYSLEEGLSDHRLLRATLEVCV